MPGRVEVAIVVARVVHDLHIAVSRRAPLDERQHGGRGTRLEHGSILVEPMKNGRADGKHHAGRAVAGRGEYVMNQPPMEPAVAIGKRMRVDEAERDRRGGCNGIAAATDRARGVLDHAEEQILEVLWPRADVIGNGFLGLAIVRADKPAFLPNAQRDEPRVSDHDTLKAFQLNDAEGTKAGFSNGLSPTSRARARRPFPLDRERRLGVVEEQEGGRACHQILAGAADDLTSTHVQVFGDCGRQRRRSADHRAKSPRPWQIVDDLMAGRRYALRAGKLLTGIHDGDDADLAWIRNVEFASRQPLIQEPDSASEGTRGR